MTAQRRNGPGNGQALKPTKAEPGSSEKGPGGYPELLSEALAIKQTLHDALARASRLVAALKRHRRQSKLVATTLASLKELQPIDG